ncbi:MAG TPA: IPExxxVDY family protein [Bacteroidales bacterium]|nr:IPExxxVDY family protein [Bacteroidales bacterium]HOE05279.1 IPExxxVDY family protein [Bacteroidales bacterium]
MKKKTLKFQPEYDFKLLGAVSSSSDIRFVREIKLITGLEMIRNGYHEIYNEKSPDSQKFFLYECPENDEIVSIYVVGNKSEAGFLIEELRNIDFFVVIKGTDRMDFASELMKNLKSNPVVQALFDIDPEKLASKQKLLM